MTYGSLYNCLGMKRVDLPTSLCGADRTFEGQCVLARAFPTFHKHTEEIDEVVDRFCKSPLDISSTCRIVFTQLTDNKLVRRLFSHRQRMNVMVALPRNVRETMVQIR